MIGKLLPLIPASALALCLQSLSSTASAQEHLGTQGYDSHNGSGTHQLDAWVGEHVVYYHNPDEVTLDQAGIATILDYFDRAMEMYWSYGGSDYPLQGEDCASDAYSVYPNTGSVTLLPYAGGGSGLGCNGAAEVYGAWWNDDSLANHPTDVRTWHIGLYELGRLSTSSFPVNDYFETPYAQGEFKNMSSALPHLVKHSVRSDTGLDDASWANDPYWGLGNEFRGGANAVNWMNKLNAVFATGADYLDFYDTSDGRLPDGDGEMFTIASVQWLVFYNLRELYGAEFAEEFFDFANEHALEMMPTSGEEIAQNIMRAGNVALSRVSSEGVNENQVGSYLRDNFMFPEYSDSNDIRLDAAVTRVAPGQETVIAWDVWGSALASSQVQVYIDSGSGWQLKDGYALGQTSTTHVVPDTGTFRVFVGVTRGGQWLTTDYRSYSVGQISLALNDVPEGLSTVGHARISWETDVEVANSEFQFWVDYPSDGRGWIFLGTAEKEDRDKRIPLEDGHSSATIFMGISKSGSLIRTNSRTFSLN